MVMVRDRDFAEVHRENPTGFHDQLYDSPARDQSADEQRADPREMLDTCPLSLLSAGATVQEPEADWWVGETEWLPPDQRSMLG